MNAFARTGVRAAVIRLVSLVLLSGTAGAVRAEDESVEPLQADAVKELLFQRFDENFNEKLDRWEVVAARRRLADILDAGAEPSPIAASDWKEDMMPLFQKLDRDGNELLDAEEILAARRVLGRLLAQAEDDSADSAIDEPRPESRSQRPRSSRRPSSGRMLGTPGWAAGGGFPFNPFSFFGSGLGGGGLGDAGFGSFAGGDFGGEVDSGDWGWSIGSEFSEGDSGLEFGEGGTEMADLTGEVGSEPGAGEAGVPEGELDAENPDEAMNEGAMEEERSASGKEHLDGMGEEERPPEDSLGDELAETAGAGEEEGEMPMEEPPMDESGEGGKRRAPKTGPPDF